MTELEKKAIDVIRNHSHKLIDKFTQEDLENREISIFMAGYHEGNKANEWHYVKDGDLPKETDLLMSKTLLLVTKLKGSDCLSLALGKYNFSTQEFSYQHIVGLTDVIAWKEIVLPELKDDE